ncbi:MFS transporter [Nakamurella sp.]|uniref:MFS transporter n=1 Tax=Nakamurella sp. TaxID=1869182 RepID=UPI0037838B00
MLRIPGMPALVAMSLLGFTSFFLTLSALPVYAVGQGVPEALAGLVTTVMLVATVACQLLVPAAVRRIGQPATLAVGLIALGAPTPLLLLRDDLWWLLLLSAVRGLGFAILTVLTPLVATQIAPPGSHGRAIGLYGLAVAVPNIFAVPAAVALTEAGHFAVVAGLGAVPLLALPLVGRFPKPPPRGQRRAGAARPPVWSLAGVLALLLATTLAGGGIFAIVPVQLAGSGAVVTWALLLLGVTSALARWRAGSLADRAGPARLLPAVAVIGALGLALLAWGAAGTVAWSAVLVAGGAAVFGIAYGGVQNLTLLLSFDLAGPERRAGASAAWNATYDAGTAVGALLIGAVAAGSSLTTAMVGCALLVLVSAVAAVLAARGAGQ